jgi:hypothetical protein
VSGWICGFWAPSPPGSLLAWGSPTLCAVDATMSLPVPSCQSRPQGWADLNLAHTGQARFPWNSIQRPLSWHGEACCGLVSQPKPRGCSAQGPPKQAPQAAEVFGFSGIHREDRLCVLLWSHRPCSPQGHVSSASKSWLLLELQITLLLHPLQASMPRVIRDHPDCPNVAVRN